MNKWIFLCCLFLICHEIPAKSKFRIQQAGFGTGMLFSPGTRQLGTHFSGLQFWTLGSSTSRFQIGLGIQGSMQFANRKILYTTAPAALTKEEEGLTAWFAADSDRNIDTLQLSKTSVYSINACLALQYQFLKKFSMSCLIDLAGFSVGRQQEAELTYGEEGEAWRYLNAKPTKQNLMLFGDHAIGNIYGHLLLGYQYKPGWQIHAGLRWGRTEYWVDNPVIYTTSHGIIVGTDLYQSISILPSLGISYRIKPRTKSAK